VQDKVVGIATFVASLLFVVVGSLLTQKSHPPRDLLRPAHTGGS
jgi:hypothetical protein